jgi:hyperosmotically inducible periplasmic protein
MEYQPIFASVAKWHGTCLKLGKPFQQETRHGEDARSEQGDAVLQSRRRDLGHPHTATTTMYGEHAMRRAFKTIAIVLMLASFVAGCKTMTGKTAGENIDDGTITASVKSKLVADKASNMTRVNVDTNNATVYLNGTVETPEQKARAEQLAWQVKGVKSVVNNLQVQRR